MKEEESFRLNTNAIDDKFVCIIWEDQAAPLGRRKKVGAVEVDAPL
jgi:hypothetical protein